MHPLDYIEEHLAHSILSPNGKAQYRLGDVAARELRPFVDEIRAVSAAYVSHRVGTTLSSPISSLKSSFAYALYYSPINAAKLLHLLPHIQISKPTLSVLDVGCGPGTAGFALLAEMPQNLDLTCIETSPAMRSAAAQLLKAWPAPGKLHSLTLKPALSDLAVPNSFDLVIAANVLAELPEHEAKGYSRKLAAVVGQGGYLIIIEPGQLAHTRRAMQIRDLLLQEFPELTPRFPCLRADSCPMLLASENDWCHGTIEWNQPRLHRQLDTLLGFNKHRIKFSAFIFQRGASLLPGVRVLTPPRKNSRGVEGLVCGKNLYGLVLISKAMRGPATRAFEKAGVFDRLIFDPPCVGEAPAIVVVSTPSEGHI